MKRTSQDKTPSPGSAEKAPGGEKTYRALFDAVQEAILVHDVQTGDILDVNRRAAEMYGYGPEEFKRLKVGDLSSGVPPYDHDSALQRLRKALAGQPQTFDWRARDKSGRLFWVEVCLKRAVIDGADRLLAMVRDISRRKSHEEQLRLAAQIFENTIEGVTVTDPDGVIEMVNPAFTAITGYHSDEVVGKKPSILRSDHQSRGFYEQMWRDLKQKGHWRGELWNRRKNGEAYPEWLTISAIRGEDGEITHHVGLFHDITDAKRNQDLIRHQAYHDALTGLPNRLLFHDRLVQAMAHARRRNSQVGVLYMDLDNFKRINDGLGHAVGDLLLRAVAERLMDCLREEDTIARLGGDEFVVVVLAEDGGQAPAVAAAERILRALADPFNVGGHELTVGASLGVALFPEDGGDADTLLKNADLAMYRAKEHGKGDYRLFTKSLNDRTRRRQLLEGELRRGLRASEMVLHYQPQVETASGAVPSCEALLRWQHPQWGLIPPGEFMSVAVQTGLVLPLGREVLTMACRQARLWERRGMPVRVAVNISALQFVQEDLADTVRRELAETGLNPGLLELEITEGTAMGNLERTIRTLERLTGLGLSISLDDFGTGFSSLLYLKRLPLSAVKVARSFVAGMADDAGDRAVVKAVTGIGHGLGLQVVALGAETAAQLAMLGEMGVDLVQGEVHSMPLPPEEFETFMLQRRRG